LPIFSIFIFLIPPHVVEKSIHYIKWV
jgi:hypothetical protein